MGGWLGLLGSERGVRTTNQKTSGERKDEKKKKKGFGYIRQLKSEK